MTGKSATRIISLALILVLVGWLPAESYAVGGNTDGEAALRGMVTVDVTDDVISGADTGAFASELVIEGDPIFYTTLSDYKDDEDNPGYDDTGLEDNTDNEYNPPDAVDDCELEVYAKIIGDEITIYSVDIEWGDMKFVYDAGGRTWDPSTHTYIGGTGEAGWLIDNATQGGGEATEWYLEQGNNAITVTNHSNRAIDAAFHYDMLSVTAFNDMYFTAITGDATVFNAESSTPNAVAGGFYADEEDAKSGALVLNDINSDARFNTLPHGKISLPTAEGRAVESVDVIGTVYFAFSGTPDAGRSRIMPDFRKIGSISVIITPNDDPGLNTPGTDF